ncbi:thioesterase [Flavobacteriales bacterium 34_180_T64]|nr:thioesterase [Flavobacteriales bacterium 34_180_T64]
MQIFEFIIRVTEDDLDQLNHVNNVRYVQWVQDIAGKHWISKAPQSICDNYYWVMLSHHIKYKGQAIIGDELLLKTYIKKLDGLTCTRIVEIYNSRTNKLLTSSETLWCFISTHTKKPVRITEEIRDLIN